MMRFGTGCRGGSPSCWMRVVFWSVLLTCAGWPLSSAAADPEAIEAGKAYGAQANDTLPDAAAMDPGTVPGFETSTPPEADYYDNPAAMEDAAIQEAGRNDAAQAVTEGFAGRPQFIIDRDTDPMLRRQRGIEADPASITGALGGEYSGCETVTVETPRPGTTEICQENRALETRSCTRRLVVACDPERDGCDPGGIVPGSWSGDMRVSLTAAGGGNFILQFGVRGDNYWNGGAGRVFDRTLTLEISDADLVSRFALTRASFDDWILVKVNGQTVYVGPYGGDRLELVRRWRFLRVRYCDNCYGSPELSTSWNRRLNIDLRPWLRTGTNTIFMRTIVGGGGEGAIQITTRQKCPRECRDTWDESQCAALQARTQP